MSEVESTPLSHEVVKKGLGVIGKHPIMLNHAYLELKIPEGNVSNIDILENFPHLMHLTLAKNAISDLRVLENLPTLVQLDVSNNKLTDCLNFNLANCTSENAWANGDTAIGSMLTLANLSFNSIGAIGDLSHHLHLEVLVLSNNNISKIQGLSSLKFLNVLDLSFNKIAKIEGLDGLNVQELNLEGNLIADLSGLDKLPRLSSLNVSKNEIMSLSPLVDCTQLRILKACDNRILYIRQCEFLKELPWLGVVELMGNAAAKKQLYRRRVLFHLPKLQRLDKSDVVPEEYIETANLYGIDGGSDVSARSEIFTKHYPNDVFEVHGPFFMDDEESLTREQLLTTFNWRDDFSAEDEQKMARQESQKFLGELTAQASQLESVESSLREGKTESPGPVDVGAGESEVTAPAEGEVQVLAEAPVALDEE